MNPPQAGPRREALAVAALTLLGAVVRVWGVGGLGLSHFDEGIYAASGLWVFSPGGLADLQPSTVPYAPPAYPALVGLAYVLAGGPSDLAAIAVSLVAGIATIPVAAWIGRRTFGPGAGAATAAFASLAGPHVAFSRMALTDATFLLAWLTAVGLGTRFVERPRGGRALAFGLAVGLAQLVKYNGWLAGVVIVVAAWPALRAPRGEKHRVIGYGAAAAIVAGLAYVPWFRFVEAHGGYAALLAHQRSYTGGFGSWLPHLRSQLAQGIALSGGPSWIVASWMLAALGGGSVAGGFGGWGRAVLRRRLAYLLAVGAFVGGLCFLGSIAWLLALFTAPILLRAGEPGRRVLGSWILLLSVLTPLYHPYARLWLPLHAAIWIVLGGVLAQGWAWVARADDLPLPRFDGRLAVIGSLVLALGVSTIDVARARRLGGLLDPTDGLRRQLETQVRPMLEESKPARVLMLARPPVSFYLGGRLPLVTVGDQGALAVARRPGDWILVDDAILGSDRQGPGSGASRLGGGTERQFPFWSALPARLDEDPELPYRPEALPDLLRVTRPEASPG